MTNLESVESPVPLPRPEPAGSGRGGAKGLIRAVPSGLVQLRARQPVSRTVLSGSLAVLDMAIVVCSALFASLLRHGDVGGDGMKISSVYVAMSSAVAMGILLRAQGLYHLRSLTAISRQINVLLRSWLMTGLATISVGFLTHSDGAYSRGWVLTWFATAVCMFVASRAGLAYLMRNWVAEGRLTRTAVIFGAGEQATALIDTVRRMPGETLSLVGIFDDRATRLPGTIAGVPVIGGLPELDEYVRSNQIDEVIIALPAAAHGRINEFARKLSLLPIDLRIAFDVPTDRLTIKGFDFYGNMPIGKVFDRPLQSWNAVIKRAMDIVVSTAGILVLGPALMLIAILVKLDSPGPALFRQKRFGFNNKVIDVLKFRTMYIDRQNVSGELQTRKNDPRVTRIGRFLRASSLDELPQLFNVLGGSMSLVGPRPHALGMRAADKLYYEAVSEYFGRHKVKPGITGWAQVHGLRGETDTLPKAQARVEHDLHYIENWTPLFDLKIILKTFRVILGHKNAY